MLLKIGSTRPLAVSEILQNQRRIGNRILELAARQRASIASQPKSIYMIYMFSTARKYKSAGLLVARRCEASVEVVTKPSLQALGVESKGGKENNAVKNADAPSGAALKIGICGSWGVNTSLKFNV